MPNELILDLTDSEMTDLINILIGESFNHPGRALNIARLIKAGYLYVHHGHIKVTSKAKRLLDVSETDVP